MGVDPCDGRGHLATDTCDRLQRRFVLPVEQWHLHAVPETTVWLPGISVPAGGATGAATERFTVLAAMPETLNLGEVALSYVSEGATVATYSPSPTPSIVY